MYRSPETPVHAPPRVTSKWMTRAGLGLTGVVALFLFFDAAIKLSQLPIVLATTQEMGWPTSSVVPLGVILLVATILYISPRTAVLGAIFLTGYLGGAVATHARIGTPMFTHTLFGVYVGVLLWLGLVLRNSALRSALGFRVIGPDERAPQEPRRRP
jgi:hypothetical protein